MSQDADSAIASKPRLVIVTGMSGAGRTVGIHTLEDAGFFCIDNLPFALLESVGRFIVTSGYKHCAIGMDVRDSAFVEHFLETRSHLNKSMDVDVVFLSADDETLLNRYVSSRRKHPLLDTGGELLAAIKRERAILEPIERAADVVFDTSITSPHELARQLEQRYQHEGPRRLLHVTITSFGFKYGMLRSADTIFDVRFLSNPHFVAELKSKTGLDRRVSDFVMNDDRAKMFLDKIFDLNQSILPHYFSEGKHYFRIGIGCTGGKHRSVAITEQLALRLNEANLENIIVSVSHRDINEFNPLNRG
jgi:UPF0042 nucleotide-binding protein